MFTILPQGYFNSPAYWYDLFRRDLDLMQVLSVKLYYINFMIISETKDEGKTDSDAMATHMTNRSCC